MQLVDAQFRIAVFNAQEIVQVSQPLDYFIASRIVKDVTQRQRGSLEVRIIENTKELCEFTATTLRGELRVTSCSSGCCLQVDESPSPPTPFGVAAPPLQRPVGIVKPGSTFTIQKLGADGKLETIHESKISSVEEAQAIVEEYRRKYRKPVSIVSPENPVPAPAPSPTSPLRGPSALASAFKVWSLWRAFQRWLFRYRPQPAASVNQSEEPCCGK